MLAWLTNGSLHKELVDFFEYAKPQAFEKAVRKELVDKLKALVKRKWPNANVKPFGSYMSGLYLPIADMDLVICSNEYLSGGAPILGTKTRLYTLKNHLVNLGVPHENDVEVIAMARVPIIKYVDGLTGLPVDISFENLTGPTAINTFLAWKEKYPAMPVLVAVIKHFLCMRGLNEPANGGIGGFSVICLVVNLFNNWPAVQSGSLDPRHHLGEALMRFFKLYGYEFAYETTAIRMDPPGFVSKVRSTSSNPARNAKHGVQHSASKLVYRNMDRLSIIDPNDPTNDIAGGSANFPLIKTCFREAFDTLTSRMHQLKTEQTLVHGHNTILAPVFAGNYRLFRMQRVWMKGIHDGTTPLPPKKKGPQW